MLLKRQHREVEKLFATALKTGNGNARRRAMDEIIHALQDHTEIEEKTFYPAVREIGTRKAQEVIGEASEEHHVVKLVLAELPEVDRGADNFEARMTVLKELVPTTSRRRSRRCFPWPSAGWVRIAAQSWPRKWLVQRPPKGIR